LSNFCDELLWLEIATSVGSVIFAVFYRPPAQDINYLVALNNCLMSIVQYPVILCGDFNLPSITGLSHFLQYPHPLRIYYVI